MDTKTLTMIIDALFPMSGVAIGTLIAIQIMTLILKLLHGVGTGSVRSYYSAPDPRRYTPPPPEQEPAAPADQPIKIIYHAPVRRIVKCRSCGGNTPAGQPCEYCGS